MRCGKLAVILHACAFLFLALPAFALESDNFTCTVSGVETLTITGYTGPGGAVIIPSMLAGRQVVGIGAGAFFNRSSLTSVAIPAGVTIIGPSAFSGCSGLRHALFHGHAPVMGASVFAGCASDFTVYADSGKAGFTYPKWDGYRAAPCTDADHDGYSIQGGACGKVDCNDNASGVNPAAAEACNGIDDDCDGAPDNGLPFASYYRDGDADGYGDPDSAGRLLACEQPEGYADNSTGFDCDDNDTAVHPGAPDENCNGVDEDCDNATDEGFEGVATSCGLGACARSGSTSCPAGAEEPVDSCVAGEPEAGDVTCNGIDENCDGTADEGYVPELTTCGVGACASQGYALCMNGAVQNTCTARRPSSDATCNGIDEDCDGVADDDYAAEQTSCGVGICAGNTGSTACVAGSVVDSCDPLAGALTDTTCNGIDEDCDGLADDDYAPEPTTCGVGACMSEGVLVCVNGVVQDTCAAGWPSSDATCNGIDEDCDGRADDDYAARPTSCGVGACAATGAALCVNGAVQDNCTAGSPAAETCNGIDDDCDGVSDNGFEFISYYRDSDADTYGNKNQSVETCDGPPEGYVDSLADNKTAMAFDCDDSDASVHAGCPCSLQVSPRRIFKLLAFFDPFIPFVVNLDKDSGFEFFRPIAIDWGTEAINDVIRSKIGPRSIVGFLLVRPFRLEPGEFDVTVSFGPDSSSCAGTISVE
jgi:hypothetical protein